MEATELTAYTRKEAGKGPARRLRNKGFVPAIFYGAATPSVAIYVSTAALIKLMKENEENVFIKLKIDDGGKFMEKLSLLKDLQTEPVSRRLIHADFYEISMDHKMTFDVSLHFEGTPAGVEQGGELLQLKREVKVSCLPSALPEHITVDIRTLQVGHSIKVRDLPKIEGLTLLESEDTALVTIATTKAEVEAVPAEAVEEESKEPEVIKQKAKETE